MLPRRDDDFSLDSVRIDVSFDPVEISGNTAHFDSFDTSLRFCVVSLVDINSLAMPVKSSVSFDSFAGTYSSLGLEIADGTYVGAGNALSTGCFDRGTYSSLGRFFVGSSDTIAAVVTVVFGPFSLRASRICFGVGTYTGGTGGSNN